MLVYQHEEVDEKVVENRRKFYFGRLQFANLCRSHTPIWVDQHEFVNTYEFAVWSPLKEVIKK